MIGRKVNHKVYGEGKILSKTGKTITIKFQNEEKNFLYPYAFDNGFLTTDDEKLKKVVEDDIAYDKKQKELEIERKKFDRENTSDISSKKQPHKNSPTNKIKNKEPLNIAFRYNYCNGGATQTSIGFNGVCSDRCMSCNAEALSSNCANNELCNQYLNGEIDRVELEDHAARNGLCYESILLRDWTAYSGREAKTDKPKSIARASEMKNKLAIMTTCETKSFDISLEAERFIFAVFLIEEAFKGDNQDEGYVKAHSKWRIELSAQEAKKMLFWNYYQNPNAPNEIKWSQGLFRYISDEQAKKILEDIVKIKNNQAEKDFAQEFLDKYCEINKI